MHIYGEKLASCEGISVSTVHILGRLNKLLDTVFLAQASVYNPFAGLYAFSHGASAPRILSSDSLN